MCFLHDLVINKTYLGTVPKYNLDRIEESSQQGGFFTKGGIECDSQMKVYRLVGTNCAKLVWEFQAFF